MGKTSIALLAITASVIITSVTLIHFRAEAVEHHGFIVNDSGEHGGSYSECRTCHCDEIAQEPPPCMPVCAIGRSHPTNVNYPPSHKREEFRSIEEAEGRGMKFVDGKVDCISCHNLIKINSKNHLRFENHMDMCNACHTKLD